MNINEGRWAQCPSKGCWFSPFVQNGFTLLELIITMMILGVISAIAIPNYLTQVSKARMTDGKTGLGAINRAQQVYNFENGVFANSLGLLDLKVGIWNGTTYESTYYSYSLPVPPTAMRVNHLATVKTDYEKDLRDIASTVFKDGSTFTIVVCHANQPLQTPPPSIIDVNNCQNGSFAINY